jgi:hypothetical protein
MARASGGKDCFAAGRHVAGKERHNLIARSHGSLIVYFSSFRSFFAQTCRRRFHVLVGDKPCPVELAIGSLKDLRSISHWRVPAQVQNQPAVRDALEFARLASKRHRQYSTTIPTAHNLSAFRSILVKQAQAEIALLFVARAKWFKPSPILGIAQCRRTYCHHFILEFLAVHPSIVGQVHQRVSGIGKGLVYGMAEIANNLGVEVIWGEATANSAPFYSHILFGPAIKDHFFIEKPTLVKCGKEFREKFCGELD